MPPSIFTSLQPGGGKFRLPWFQPWPIFGGPPIAPLWLSPIIRNDQMRGPEPAIKLSKRCLTMSEGESQGNYLCRPPPRKIAFLLERKKSAGSDNAIAPLTMTDYWQPSYDRSRTSHKAFRRLRYPVWPLSITWESSFSCTPTQKSKI